ncbi:MAG: NAD-dependent epimerase/dehydratase family protein [Thermogemmatispora sp.]|uniref:NAD-dependent epimerase/dehydratase family protein n=2 Tax=Thermogemmatispora sp. TaxID=1968838 RepID=UPI001DAB0E7A|nr:NAD-dependent epimerase/dehydratase family protein [Thermogemmatispora sp.]MBX5449905.1 NAD-dependent epimerase/dehydratase family protein [Thermogemmatispora sp.]
MRCLITGVAGFIGSHLAERLLSEGHEVCGIDVFNDCYPRQVKEQNIEGLLSSSRFDFIEGDLLRLPLVSLLDGVDWVFHLAARAGVRQGWGTEFGRYVDANVLATQRLLEAAVRAGNVRRFICASSSAVYGEATRLPVNEMAPLRPVSPYGVTKVATEQLCMLYHRNYGLPVVILRYFTVYGPRQRPDMAFYRFCSALVSGQPAHVYGDGLQTRDVTYVDDVVEANLLAATAPAAVGMALNIAGGVRVSILEVLDLLGEISGAPLPVVFLDEQRGEAHDTFADISQASLVLGYSPRVGLREGLRRELDYVIAYARSLTSRLYQGWSLSRQDKPATEGGEEGQ